MRRSFFVSVVAVLMFATVSFADALERVIIDGLAGSGANEAICVVDFDTASYAFSYQWDDSAVGEDMLLALDAETDLTVAYHYHSTFGFAVDGFSYDGYSIVSDGWVTTFPGYWLSTDGETWVVSDDGASSRALSDGVWDGWSQEYVANDYSTIYEPDTPLAEFGDANCNRVVDDDDLAVLLSRWNEVGGWAYGDFNDTDYIDDDDLALLLAYWTTPAAPGIPGEQIPEPATIMMCLIGAVGLLRNRRRVA